MERPEPYVIRANDRTVFVGKTGSGKTAAVKKLVWEPLDRVIFADIKGREHRDLNYPVLESLEQARAALTASDPDDRLEKFVIRPKAPDIEWFDALCQLVYDRGGTHLIADELKSVYHGSSLTNHHNLLLTNGRDKGVGFTATTQRPQRIPREAISEAEHVFTFRLKDPDDVDRIDTVTAGELPEEPKALDRYHYIYDHEDLDAPRLHEPLDL